MTALLLITVALLTVAVVLLYCQLVAAEKLATDTIKGYIRQSEQLVAAERDIAEVNRQLRQLQANGRSLS